MTRESYDFVLKFVLIGDAGVGKSCVLLRFADDSFNFEYSTTLGVDFRVRTVETNGRRVKLQLWDTAGQERFENITSSFYRGAHGVLLVYDVTNSKSFYNLERWLNTINEHVGDVARILVGNKNDLEEKRVIGFQKGQILADQLKMRFLETSAMKNFNIESVFMELVEESLLLFPHLEKPRRIETTIEPKKEELKKREKKCCL